MSSCSVNINAYPLPYSLFFSSQEASSLEEKQGIAAPHAEERMQTSLENRFSHLAFPDEALDIHKPIAFDNYLTPNEGNPQNIHPLLQEIKPGFLVSTGTERSFFNLLFINHQNCRGLIVRDINPKVKAYVDFNVLLLKTSKTCEEYHFLSILEAIDWSQSDKFDKITTETNKRIEIIRQKILTSRMNPAEERYYLRNLYPS